MVLCGLISLRGVGDASEQAASAQETSAALEEMATMTRQNAANAEDAHRLAADTPLVFEEAGRSMGALDRSMSDSSPATEETSKIVRAIDGIVFQTHLLALNAPIEAARAREVGRRLRPGRRQGPAAGHPGDRGGQNHLGGDRRNLGGAQRPGPADIRTPA